VAPAALVAGRNGECSSRRAGGMVVVAIVAGTAAACAGLSAFTACLLTDSEGLAGAAAPAWAGMQDASRRRCVMGSTDAVIPRRFQNQIARARAANAADTRVAGESSTASS
jgi:hypothetical protein